MRINVRFVTYEQVPPELGMWLLGGTHAEKRTSVTPAPPVSDSSDIEARPYREATVNVASAPYVGQAAQERAPPTGHEAMDQCRLAF